MSNYDKEYHKKWYLANKDKVKAASLRWSNKNPEKRAQVSRRYKDSHPYELSKQRAKRRGLEWNISKEEFYLLRTKPCHYCGEELHKGAGGLDRVNNSVGYLITNVIPCCIRCNKTRNVYYTVQETEVMIKALLEFRRIK